MSSITADSSVVRTEISTNFAFGVTTPYNLHHNTSVGELHRIRELDDVDSDDSEYI